MDEIKTQTKNTPISEEFLKQKFRATTENAGTMPCFKIDIITNGSRTLTIAKWGGTHYYYGTKKNTKGTRMAGMVGHIRFVPNKIYGTIIFIDVRIERKSR